MLRFLAILIGTFSLTTNSAVATESTPTTQDCNDRDMTFEDWRQWVSITPKPVRSEGHSNNWVSIYVNETAESTYRSASSPYPFCSKIVKPIYTDASGTTVFKLTVMVKLSPGYDPENADWWYGVYDASGTTVKRQGVLRDCIPCHKQAAETDYLFSKEVGHALSD